MVESFINILELRIIKLGNIRLSLQISRFVFCFRCRTVQVFFLDLG